MADTQREQQSHGGLFGMCVCVRGPSEKTLNFYPDLFELLFSGLLMGFVS